MTANEFGNDYRIALPIIPQLISANHLAVRLSFRAVNIKYRYP